MTNKRNSNHRSVISYFVLGKPNINVPNCRSQCPIRLRRRADYSYV